MTNRFFTALLTQPLPVQTNHRGVVFKGRNRHDTQRAALRYWMQNEIRLGMQLREFRRHCIWTDGETLVFDRQRRPN